MKIVMSLVSLFLVAVLFYGCATIMHGTSQSIGVSSSPSGAYVTVDNKSYGKTPLFADLSRGNNHIVKIELDGYSPAELTITRSVSGWVWGNIIFGGLIGLAVDALTGGLYTLSPEQLNSQLNKTQQGFFKKKGAVYIVTVLQPDKNWKKIGSLDKLN